MSRLAELHELVSKPGANATEVMERVNEIEALTKAELSNGWTAESLAAYRRERDKVADIVPGNVVTEFKRGKPAIQIQSGDRSYNPHKW